MAKQRLWITVTPASKGLVQAAIDLAGFGDQIGDSPENSSWVAYPSIADTKLYYTGGVWDTSIGDPLGVAILGVLGSRIRQGKLRSTTPALTQAQAQASFPLPNVGPPASTVVTQNCAMWLHYRDFLLGSFDEIGFPDAVESPPISAAALADLVSAVATAQTTKATS